MRALRGRYTKMPYEREPVHGEFSLAHKSLVFQIVNNAREQAFRGSPDTPEASLLTNDCRTIRCRLIIGGPYRFEVAILAEAIRELRLERKPLWHSVQIRELAPGRGRNGTRYRFEILVSFQRDYPEIEKISLLGGEKLEATDSGSQSDAAGAAPNWARPGRPGMPFGRDRSDKKD